MIAPFGYLTLALAFLLAVYGLGAVIWGIYQRSVPWIESARLALVLIFPLVTVSLVAITVLLLDHRFDVAYVYSVINRGMPAYLRFTALWGGQSGSLLFWTWLMAAFAMIFALKNWRDSFDLLPWSLAAIFLLVGFFLLLNVFIENPFERFWLLPDGSRILSVFQPRGAFPLMPQDGMGLNPLLRHPGMIWHPPTLYIGFVGFLIPFALAISSLATGKKDNRWIEIARPYVLVSWVFLSLGLVLGMRWAYDILGWGGYWGWDPVEVVALMPWLSATAYLHTALLQKRNESFKRWNLSLSILTFVLVILGTFLTRAGILASIHAFADSDIGVPKFVITAIITLGSLGLLIYRWPELGDEQELEFRLSREVFTIFSNLVLLSILAVCFLGVFYPIISELLTDTLITVGPAWYKQILGPLFTLLMLLLGVCPLIAWSLTRVSILKQKLQIVLPLSLLPPIFAWLLGGVSNLFVLFTFWLVSFSGLVIMREYTRSVGKAWNRSPGRVGQALWSPIQRNRRRFGGLIVHLGIVLMSIGIIGIEGLQQQTQVTLAIGESVSIGGYEFTFTGLDNYNTADGRNVTESVLTITQNGRPLGALYPQRDFYPAMGMAITQPGLQSNLGRDLYAILIDWRPVTQDEATFRVYINPLVNWLWIGTGVLVLGSIMAVWPERVKARQGVTGYLVEN